MSNLTPAQVGRTLSRAGFTGQRENYTWAHGFKASKFMAGTVAVTARFGGDDRDRNALVEYMQALTAAGLTVEDYGTTIFVSLTPAPVAAPEDIYSAKLQEARELGYSFSDAHDLAVKAMQ